MHPSQRIRLARRHGGLSQAALAQAVGVQRSAVSHWESANAKNPRTEHLRGIALATGVNFEWLATGRGTMALTDETRLDSIATVDGLLVDDPLELRLLHALRDAPPLARVALVEITEQLASLRTGRSRKLASRTPAAPGADTPAARTMNPKTPARPNYPVPDSQLG